MMTLVKDVAATNEATVDHHGDGIERRRGLRISQARPIKVLDPTAGRYFGGQTRDVSATGLRIELPPRAGVRPGKLLTIHVGVGNGCEPLANRRQMIPARVVWVRHGDNDGGATLTAGVEFLASIAAHRDAA